MTPSARALVWSTSSRTVLASSFQSKLTSRVAGSALKTWRTCSATRADLLRIVAQHAEHHGVGDRRAVLQALHAGAHGLEIAGEQRVELGEHPLARLEVLGHDDDLAEIGVGQLRHGRQVEARAAGADIGRCSRRRRRCSPATSRAGAPRRRSRRTRRPAPAADRRSARAGWRSGRTASAPGRRRPSRRRRRSAVTAIVVLRQVTHHTTSLRKARVEPAVVGVVRAGPWAAAAGGSPSRA